MTMQPDVDAVRAAAEKASQGEWIAYHDRDHTEPFWQIDFYPQDAEKPTDILCRFNSWHGPSDNAEANAKYIGAVQPSAVLALLDRLAAAEADVATLDIGDRVLLPVGSFTVESLTIDGGKVRVMLTPDNPARFEHIAKGGA